jgi:SAM-dependent methyltransferase
VVFELYRNEEGRVTPSPACRSCRDTGLIPILSLGTTPLANALRSEVELPSPEPLFPLDLAFCPHCALVQITETIPSSHLFRDYVYFSSFSDTMLRHSATLVDRLVLERNLGPQSLAMEAASNDGYLLKNYKACGIPVLGIEPALNIARVAREQHGIPTREEFFTSEFAAQLATEELHADVFHAHNVLAHVPDLNGFVAGIRTILKPTGIAVIEAPYVKDMLDHCEFDTIYHEHLCYFSLTALDRCFRRHGLIIADVERVPIHGGSLRLFAAHAEGVPEVSSRVKTLLVDEASWGVSSSQPYLEFAKRVGQIKESLTLMLGDMKAAGHHIAGYGASAKGSTLLNFCGIGPETLDFVVDRSTVKQGKFTPGTRLRIYSPEKLLDEQPDFTLLLTWNFAEEIFQQQAEYRRRGGRFIVPVPSPRVA